MKDNAKFVDYAIKPDKKNVGDHKCRIVLEVQLGPAAVAEIAEDCSDLVGLDVHFQINKLQAELPK